MNIIQNQDRKKKLIWSNIRKKLNISLHHANLLTLLNTQETQNRLEQFLSYYIDGNKNEELKNDLKFLGNFPITNPMNNFIGIMSKCLNMTKNICFELLDNYFYLHKEEFEEISKVLNLYYSLNDKSSRAYRNILIDIEIQKINIIQFYFEERKNLILFLSDILFKIFLEIENNPLDLHNFMDN